MGQTSCSMPSWTWIKTCFNGNWTGVRGSKRGTTQKNTSQVFTSSCRSAAPPVECSAGPLPPPRAARWSRSPAHGRDPRTNARGSVRSGRGWTVDQMLVWSKVSRNSKGKKNQTRPAWDCQSCRETAVVLYVCPKQVVSRKSGIEAPGNRRKSLLKVPGNPREEANA